MQTTLPKGAGGRCAQGGSRDCTQRPSGLSPPRAEPRAPGTPGARRWAQPSLLTASSPGGTQQGPGAAWQPASSCRRYTPSGTGCCSSCRGCRRPSPWRSWPSRSWWFSQPL